MHLVHHTATMVYDHWEDNEYTVEDILFLSLGDARPGRSPHLYPIIKDVCPICEEKVDVTVRDNFYPSRINGDSKYGYELYHHRCPTQPASSLD